MAPLDPGPELEAPPAELDIPQADLDIPPADLDIPPPDLDQEHGALVLLNKSRKWRGLSQLQLDPQLGAVARAHSRDMCRNRYFSHRSADGKEPWDRLGAAGIRFRAAAENIAVGYRSARAAHEGWMGSPGHRANRLNPTFTRVGIGLYICDGQVPYWTEVFAR